MVNPPTCLKLRDWLAAFGLAALVLLGGAARIAPRVCGVYHDDAIYVSTARALAEGEGYRLSGVPGAPLQTKYPPLYPAALAAVYSFWPTFPENLLAMQIVTLLCGAATVALSYLYLVRFGYCSRGVAAAGAMMCATASFFLYFCVLAMAEMPFALLSVIALWALDTHLEGYGASRRRQFRLGLLLALPFLCRTIGAVFIVSSVAVLWRAWRPVRACLVGAAIAALPWILWSLVGRGVWDRNPIDGYYTDYVGCWSSTGFDMLIPVFRANALWVAIGSSGLVCEGLWAACEPYLASNWCEIILAAAGLIPWLMIIRPLSQGRPLPCAMAGYLLLILFWSWPPQRFLVPILPFLSAYLMAGTSWLLRPIAAAFGRPFAIALTLGALVATNLGLVGHHFQFTRETGYPLDRLTHTRVDWSSYERTLAWLRQNSQPGDVVASGLDSMVSLYAGRPAFRPFAYNPGRLFYGPDSPRLMSVDELTRILKRLHPRYLVHTPMPGFAEEKLFARVLEELRKRRPDWLQIVYQDADPRFVVFELNEQYKPSHGLQSVSQTD
ncbi:MAG TPA: hypothetical protein VGK58_19590, partial [Lacipirellulaceae bacterium]